MCIRDSYESYPVDPRLSQGAGAVRVTDLQVVDRTHFPLTLAVIPTPDGGLELHALHDPQRLEATAASRLLAYLERALEGHLLDPEKPLAALPLLSPCLLYTSDAADEN